MPERAATRPTTQRRICDGLLILPLVGTLNAKRVRQLTADLLRRIRALRARVVVMDVTSISGLDSVVSFWVSSLAASIRSAISKAESRKPRSCWGYVVSRQA
jgi:anti-anti-sigma regulatory factor